MNEIQPEGITELRITEYRLDLKNHIDLIADEIISIRRSNKDYIRILKELERKLALLDEGQSIIIKRIKDSLVF